MGRRQPINQALLAGQLWPPPPQHCIRRVHTAYTVRHNTLTEPTQAAECQYQDYPREFSPMLDYVSKLLGEEKQLLFLENSLTKFPYRFVINNQCWWFSNPQ